MRGWPDLSQGSTWVEYWHKGRNRCPTGAQNLVTTDTCGHTGNATSYSMEGTRPLGREVLLHAHCGARDSGTPLPYTTWSIPGRSEYSLNVASILSQDRGLAGTIGANVIPSHTYGQDCPPRTHPAGVMWCLGPQGRGRVLRWNLSFVVGYYLQIFDWNSTCN